LGDRNLASVHRADRAIPCRWISRALRGCKTQRPAPLFLPAFTFSRRLSPVHPFSPSLPFCLSSFSPHRREITSRSSPSRLNPIGLRFGCSVEWSTGRRHGCGFPSSRRPLVVIRRLGSREGRPRSSSRLHSAAHAPHSVLTRRARTHRWIDRPATRGGYESSIRRDQLFAARHRTLSLPSALDEEQNEGDRASASRTMRQPNRREGRSTVISKGLSFRLLSFERSSGMPSNSKDNCKSVRIGFARGASDTFPKSVTRGKPSKRSNRLASKEIKEVIRQLSSAKRRADC